jgi:hypothetical protein
MIKTMLLDHIFALENESEVTKGKGCFRELIREFQKDKLIFEIV